MGTCAIRENKEQIKTYFSEANFELSLFKRSHDFNQYLAYQNYLIITWKDFHGLDELSRDEGKGFDEWVRKGVPDLLVPCVVKSLFVMDHEKACEVYRDVQKNLSEQDPYVSSSLSSLEHINDESFYLTDAGRLATKRIVFYLNFIFDTSEILFVPKVAQGLLWYFPEAEVFYLIVSLLKQHSDVDSSNLDFAVKNKFFLGRRDCQKISEKISGFLTKQGGNQELITKVIGNMIEGFCVGYLSPLYYPFLICNFLIEKFGALAKVIISLLSCVQVSDVVTEEQIRQQVTEKFNYFRFIDKYESAKIPQLV